MLDLFELDALALASITVKFLLYLGVLKSVGMVLSIHLFNSHLNGLQSQLKRSIVLFAFIALVASVFSFSLRGADLTGDISGMTDPEILGILWQTPVGSALLFRLVGLVLFIICLLIGGIASISGLFAGLLTLWSFAEVGHVLSGELWWLKIVLFTHLLSGCFWVGILRPLALLTLDEKQLDLAASLGEKFGKMAITIVPVLILAGLVLAYFLVGSLSNLFTTSYGLVLFTKVVLVGVLLVLAAANKLRFVPAMQQGQQLAAQKLIKSIRLEWMVIMGILLVTAVLTSVLGPPS